MGASFPDMSYVIEDIREEGDGVAVTGRFSGTFVNDFDLSAMGIFPATGKSVDLSTGTALVGEVITSNFLVGAGLVLVGVLVGALLPSKSKPAAVEECKSRSGQVLPRCT